MTSVMVTQTGAFNLDAEINERRRQLSNIEHVLTHDTPGVTNRVADATHQMLIINCRLLAHGLDQATAQAAIAQVDKFVADVRQMFGGAE